MRTNEKKKFLYESPGVEIYEMPVRSIICESVPISGDIEDVTEGGEGSWYD